MTSLLPQPTPHRNSRVARRLPLPLSTDDAARRIATRYNVAAPLARIVAELVSTSLGDRR